MKVFAKKILSDVAEGSEFILHKGGFRKVKNLIDLRTELEGMPEEEYKHHVEGHRNDFAKWVETAIEDEKLSKDMLSASSKEEIVDLLTSRIDFAVSVIEEDNERIIGEELQRLKKIEKESNRDNVENDIETIEQEVEELSQNMHAEKKVLDHEDDLRLRPWDEYHTIPANARIAEFLFGLITGLILGLIVARYLIG